MEVYMGVTHFVVYVFCFTFAYWAIVYKYFFNADKINSVPDLHYYILQNMYLYLGLGTILPIAPDIILWFIDEFVTLLGFVTTVTMTIICGIIYKFYSLMLVKVKTGEMVSAIKGE
jgi:hypothetical protein